MLRQLAALDLPPAVIFGDLAERLKDIVRFEVAVVLLLDPDGAPRETLTTRGLSPEVNRRYLSRWFDGEEARFYPTPTQLRNDPALGVVRVSDRTPRFAETEIWREVHSYWGIEWMAIVACRDGRRMLGALGLGRTPAQGDFSRADIALLDEVRPLISQALAGEPRPLADMGTISAEAAMLRLDVEGKVVAASLNAWRLLRWAEGLPTDITSMSERDWTWAEPTLTALARRSLSDPRASPRRGSNPYGEFVLHAAPTLLTNETAASEIGVSIERRLPMALAMFRSADFRALSNRERTVAQGLLEGATHAEIATRMGVKPSTVVTHVRNLYARLEVNSRDGLAARLFTQDA